MDIPSTVSVAVGILSVGLALFAVSQANAAARESRENFKQTRDLLAEIDKRAEVTEKLVSESQRELLDTVRRLVIPEKPDMGEQVGMAFLNLLTQDPDKFASSVEQMSDFSDRMSRQDAGGR